MDPLIKTRIQSHLLDKFRFNSPDDVVKHYGCIQAQDIPQALWVIGSRIKDCKKEMIREACTNGTIIRSWPMR